MGFIPYVWIKCITTIAHRPGKRKWEFTVAHLTKLSNKWKYQTLGEERFSYFIWNAVKWFVGVYDKLEVNGINCNATTKIAQWNVADNQPMKNMQS